MIQNVIINTLSKKIDNLLTILNEMRGETLSLWIRIINRYII